MGARLSHRRAGGGARMVDVSSKPASARSARAEAWVKLGARLARLVRRTGGAGKGEVLETARLAGIMAAKRTAELIPMCHPLPLDAVEVAAELSAGGRVRIESRVSCRAPTGVEMEALVAAAAAALTVYDMVKSAGKGVEIGGLRLLEKRGGRSGRWVRGGPR